MKNPWGRDDAMVIAAFRYCFRRKSYIVPICVDWLIENWSEIKEKTRKIIEEELEEAFIYDDTMNPDHRIESCLLGVEFNRQEWERLRKKI